MPQEKALHYEEFTVFEVNDSFSGFAADSSPLISPSHIKTSVCYLSVWMCLKVTKTYKTNSSTLQSKL